MKFLEKHIVLIAWGCAVGILILTLLKYAEFRRLSYLTNLAISGIC